VDAGQGGSLVDNHGRIHVTAGLDVASSTIGNSGSLEDDGKGDEDHEHLAAAQKSCT
jgi:hypothetical protein